MHELPAFEPQHVLLSAALRVLIRALLELPRVLLHLDELIHAAYLDIEEFSLSAARGHGFHEASVHYRVTEAREALDAALVRAAQVAQALALFEELALLLFKDGTQAGQC